jgi:hypothetical protein
VPLSALARDIIALALERDILNRLGALAKSGDTMSGALDMDGNRITGLAAPVTQLMR